MTECRHALIIFDWDGTLMDSERKIVNCFQAAAQDCDLPVPDGALVAHQIGLTLEKAWINIFSSQGVNTMPETVERASDCYRDYFLEIDHTPMPLYDGVVEGIRELEQAGYLLAIATGKARRGLQRALAETDLQKHFVTSRCADEAYSKPHPKMLQDILEYCGCEANRALMVGDTTYDMQMAINANMDGLAVSYGVHARDELEPLASRGCAADFAEVLSLLN
jgi:phosphoglycolate phosphatase